GKIEFRNVSFTYPDTGIRALTNVSFTVNPGESLAIIGTTGSGKSTISNLIARLYDVTEGEIRIDDIPIRDYDLTALRKQMGFVPQDVFLFSDTLANNIAFGLGVLDPDKVIQAAKDADVYDNIMDFPEGFKTQIGRAHV